ncbi:MAG: DUF2236 domain-containing protein [Rubrivivax sp.]|nr:DUF2236 domain-containing protein [Rubrivivax sp.]
MNAALSGTYRRYLDAADPAADAVAATFAKLPAGRGRQMLDLALAQGIGAVNDAPAQLVEFFAQLESVPPWADRNLIDRGGTLFLRSGLVGIAALNLACLPMMYRSPAGNKPLVFTGQLLRRAPRRLAETARFMLETSRPGGLHRGAEGFHMTVRVRLMHAQVRRLLRQSGRWNPAWGEPVNQLYMAGTSITLSVVFLRSLRQLGMLVSRSDAQALLALWRYSSHLMGVMPELQVSTEAEGWRIIEFMAEFEGAPDDDSRSLMNAVMTAPYVPGLERYTWRVPMAYDLSRALVGEALADALGYPPRHGWSWVRLAVWPLLAGAEVLQRAVPAVRARAARQGTALAEKIIAQILAGGRPDAPAMTRQAHPHSAGGRP